MEIIAEKVCKAAHVQAVALFEQVIHQEVQVCMLLNGPLVYHKCCAQTVLFCWTLPEPKLLPQKVVCFQHPHCVSLVF